MMDSNVHMYGGQTNTAVEIEKKRVRKFVRFLATTQGQRYV
jgi:hypothetical protein